MATKASQLALMAQYTATDGKVNSDLIDTLDSSQFLRDDVDETMAGNLQFTGTGYVLLPSGTTAQRPGSPTPGMIRFNTDKGVLEQYISDLVWVSIAPGVTITSVSLPGSQTAISEGDVITVNGVGFDTGATVNFVLSGTSTAASSSSRVSSILMTAVVPALSEGTYEVNVTNGSGSLSNAPNGVDVDGTPVFNTPSGSLGSLVDNEDSANFNVGATEDGVASNVSITSGSLPSGLSMSGTGSITGIPAANVSSDTIYNITVTAVDSENQSSSRNFSITVLENYLQAGSTTFGA
jgi:hypothetical protein